jgi:Ca2+-binding RTX toxin-like protein
MPAYSGSNTSEAISGSIGNDTISGWNVGNAPGNHGPVTDNDSLYGGDGNDVLLGGGGDDLLMGGTGENTLHGEAGNDSLHGFGTFFGGSGDDLLVISGRVFLADGGAGNDIFYFGTSFVPDLSSPLAISGGTGIDLLALSTPVSATRGRTLALTPPADLSTLVPGIQITGIERLSFYGGSFADNVTGGAYGDTLAGGGGSDSLNGAAGDDRIEAANGAAQLLGGRGNDTLSGSAQIIDGGAGIDFLTLVIRDLAFPVILDLTDPAIAQVFGNSIHVKGIEQIAIQAGAGHDQITGGNLADTIDGGQGSNTLSGGGGDDLLLVDVAVVPIPGSSPGNSRFYGGEGNDTIRAGWGHDSLWGGDGDDFLELGSLSRQFAYGGRGIDVARIVVYNHQSTAALDISLADPAQIQHLSNGSRFKTFEAIHIEAAQFDDTITGGVFADTISGGAGNDVLSGGSSNDRLDGSLDNDTLDGGLGQDTLIGGAGADTFRFSTGPVPGEADHVADFTHGSDNFALASLAFGGLVKGTLAESAFVQSNAAADPGDRIIFDATTGVLWFDEDGTGEIARIMFAQISPFSTLTAADFTVI